MSSRHSHVRPPDSHLNGASSSSTSISPTVATNGVNGSAPSNVIQKLNAANEQTWLMIGRVAEQMGNLEHALSAYEHALRHNPSSLTGLTQVAGIARIKENYTKAIEFFQRVLALQEDNGEIWSALGHCYLMQDDLQKAYSAYQQALYLLPNPKEDPKLWYGIGILYDRYGSLDHAEEAFSSVLRMDKDLDFDKANEILFRLGIIYKQQGKYDDSLKCFDRILRSPPNPLAHADIWFQIGHVYEQQKDHVRAKDAYERVVLDNPTHAKVLQQLGWLYHQDGSEFQNQDMAIQYLTKSLEADSSDAQSWYLLGRAYMSGQKYNKAYEAYQQAVYRDGRNPTFWCSIGVLYFQINQFRDALDAYSRAIRINPYISEVWFDLGSLYESCNNQISDAIDAYARAAELDPTNTVITRRLDLLKQAQANGTTVRVDEAPGPKDVHPTAYASAVVPPHPVGLSGPPLLIQPTAHNGVSHRGGPRAESRGPGDLSLPPPGGLGLSGMRAHSPAPNGAGPFRGGPPPPVVLDDARHPPSHATLAPMEVDGMRDRDRDRDRSVHTPGHRDRDTPRERERGHHLHHPHPTNGHGHGPMHGPGESYFTRHPRAHSHSRSTSPQSRLRISPPLSATYPPSHGRGPVSPAHHNAVPSLPPLQRSPRPYASSAHHDSRPNTGVGIPLPPPPSRDWEPRPQRHQSGPGEYPERSPATHPRFWDDRDRERGRYDPTRETLAASPDGPRPHVSTRQAPPEPHHEREQRSRRSSANGPSSRSKREPETELPPPSVPMNYRLVSGYEPRPASSSGSSGGQSRHPRSVQPSPTSATASRVPSRVLDEDYDEPGVVDALIGLASAAHDSPRVAYTQGHHPRDSISSNRGHGQASPPPSNTMNGKRPLSPSPSDSDSTKRSRMDYSHTHNSRSPHGHTPPQQLPTQSTRPSPIPFRTGLVAPKSPTIGAVVLPPHPRPVGVAREHSSQRDISTNNLPSIATLSSSPDREMEVSKSPEQRDKSRSPPKTISGSSSPDMLS